jgi:MoaA/NifB/PqqE/SkfB family radical SAM enzyme
MVLNNVDYHITDRCNLNCVSCGHFCPLVPSDTEDKSVGTVINDLIALYKATNNGRMVDHLTITGGEITIHPHLEYIVEIASSLFSNRVILWTNGKLYNRLINMKSVLLDRRVLIYMTDYAQSYTETAIASLKDAFGDRFYYITRKNDNGTIKFNNQFFSSEEVADDNHIINCYPRYNCMQLVDKKLYLCQYAAYFPYFDNYFKGKHNLKLTGNEYIDLTKVTNFSEIEEFVKSTKLDICSHCLDCLPDRETQEWRKSDKELKEWYKDNG